MASSMLINPAIPTGVERHGYGVNEPGWYMSSFADFSSDGQYRYALGRRWSDGPRLSWVMLNPSKADEKTDDLTIRKCIGFAERRKYGAILVVNLYARVMTDPKKLFDVDNPEGTHAEHYLHEALRVARRDAGEICAAWGNVPAAARGRALRWQAALREAGAFTLGTTRSGMPRHPSRLAYETQMVRL